MAPARDSTDVMICGCGLVLMLILIVVMTIIVIRTMISLYNNPPVSAKGILRPTGEVPAKAVVAVAACKPSKDVTDYRVLDQSDIAGPVPLRPEERLRVPPVFPGQDPFYPLRNQPPEYQQLGVLSAMNEQKGEPIVLPLFGKRIGRDRWNYYTSTDSYTMLRIPVSQNGRDCSDRYNGCPELYDGDTVVVPTYERGFKVTLYPYRGPVF